MMKLMELKLQGPSLTQTASKPMKGLEMISRGHIFE